MTKDQALATKIHFGKNQGMMLSELSPQQRSWYADDWLRKKERGGGDISPNDLLLMGALKFLYPLKKDQSQPSLAPKPEDESQEPQSLLTALGHAMANSKVSDQELTEYLQRLRRANGQPVLREDQEVPELPDADITAVLKNWDRVKAEIVVQRRKKQEEQITDASPAPLN